MVRKTVRIALWILLVYISFAAITELIRNGAGR